MAAPSITTQPLDPLTGDEIVAAVAVLREARGLGERVRFVSVELREPAKEALAAGTPPREAFLVILTNDDGMTHEAIVSLDDRRLVDWRDVPGVHPAIHIDEFDDAGNAIVADPRFQEALARRGIEHPDMVMVDPWSIGCFEDGDRRLARGLAWLRSDLEGDNGYSRPIGGLVGVVDLNTMEVVRIDDHGVLPVPSGEGGDYRPGALAPPRTDVRAYEITQPDGPSFTLDGHALAWQGWTLDVGFSPREGLVLHRIAYAGRPVCHRASIAELVIPYGDPNPTVHFKNAFDIGEYGLGPLVNALELGCDCLGEISYLDAWVNDSRGGALALPNAICIHEEDIGILWKHFDYRSGRTDVARARRLVVSCIATVGNYEYGFYWYLGQDGTIGFEAKLTGVLHTAGVPEGEPGPYATEIAPGVAASVHQHFFCARLDMDVDGTTNTVVEIDALSEPRSPHNPDGTAFLDRPDSARSRVAGPAVGALGGVAALAGRERGAAKPHRRADRLRAHPRRGDRADGAPGLGVPAAGAVPRPPSVGDAVRGGRALPGRRVPQPEPGRRRPRALDEGQPPARGRGRRPLVHVRIAPRAAARGLAGDAGRAVRVRAQAGWVLRPESGA